MILAAESWLGYSQGENFFSSLKDFVLLRLIIVRQTRHQIVPLNNNIRQHANGGFAAQFVKLGLAVFAVNQAIDGQNAVNRVNQPILTHAVALIKLAFLDLVVTSRGRRQDFYHPIPVRHVHNDGLTCLNHKPLKRPVALQYQYVHQLITYIVRPD
jgi:hypothetical protein